MKRSIGLWQIWGFAITSLMGTILHYLYDWLGKSIWIAPFSGVNESTWEHMKLLFWPMFIYAIIQSFFFKNREDFWCIKLRGILLGLGLIPIIFYTYNGMVTYQVFFTKLICEGHTTKTPWRSRKAPYFVFNSVFIMGCESLMNL